MSAESYLSRGVSPTKDDVKAAVKNQSKGVFPGAFCKLIEDLAGDPEFCTAIHADGAGTKSSVAYLMYKETGNYDWFKGLAQDSLVMNTDDLACCGVTDNLMLSNTIGRNAHRVDGKAIAKVIEGYDEIIAKLAANGINIAMCGGETADVGDLVKTLIVDSTLVARAKRSDVINAAKACGCHDFIMQLEHGYNTVVGGAGGHLSGGERQRISIARAMLKNAPVVILDEATAYTDPENEALVQSSVAKLVQGKTLLVIAHRLSTIASADQIILINDGKVEAVGTQQELLKKSPLYTQMWNAHMAVREGA